MNNDLHLPANASYTPEGAITFQKTNTTAIDEEILLQLVSIRRMLEQLQLEVMKLKLAQE